MADLKLVTRSTGSVALDRIIEEVRAEAEARVDANPTARTRYNRVYHRHNRS